MRSVNGQSCTSEVSEENTGLDVSTHDSYFTIIVAVLTNHILAEKNITRIL